MHAHIDKGAAPALDIEALNEDQKALRRKTHQTIAKVSDDIGRRYTFNTAIAASMELLNAVNKLDADTPQGIAVEREALDAVVLVLSPIVPHICHTLWSALGHETVPVDESWPTFDESALEQDTIEIVVQVNGKLRGRISVAVDLSRDEIGELAMADENVRRFIGDKEVRKVIVVPGRLVNIVV